MTTPPEQAKKMNIWLRVLIGVCGLIAVVGGIAKMTHGIQEIRGASHDGAQYKQTLQEIDAAVEAANKYGLEAAPTFQKLLNDIDSQGLATVRKQEKQSALNVAELFGKSAEQYRIAAAKSQAAAKQNIKDSFKPFFAAKTRGYGFFAQAREMNQQITKLVIDESIPKFEDLLPKMQEVATRRDAAQKSAEEAEAEATELGKKANANSH